MRATLKTFWLTAATASWFVPAQAVEYEIGGPLEGLKLPLYKTKHGEPAGYPGVIEGRTTEGLYPDFELVPGSPEHYHAYWQKYTPVRSMLDAQSLLRSWSAPQLAMAAGVVTEPFSEPVYQVRRHAVANATGLFNPPVPVLRAKVQAPQLKIDLGELPIGMYCLKTVGAVETKYIRQLREALYYTVRVNDGPQGTVNSYRQRLGYVDDLYSVSEVYFHSDGKRRYTADVMVDEGSRVELLIHHIELHDVLAGCVQRPIKKSMNLITPEQRRQLRAQAASDGYRARQAMEVAPRLARDAALWEFFPDINHQVALRGGTGGVYNMIDAHLGADGMTRAQLEEKYGAWEVPRFNDRPDLLLLNKKLNLTYSMQDAVARKPLPDPYPLKDTGAGLQTGAGEAIRNWQPIGDGNHLRIADYLNALHSEAAAYEKFGDSETARDAAIRLVRFAYDLPSSDPARVIDFAAEQPGNGLNRDLRQRWRETQNFQLEWYSNHQKYIEDYDKLYDYIAGNEQFAASVGRFVPWVKSSADVIQLLDVYLVQHFAKRVLRYNWFTGETAIVTVATVLADRNLTDPWMAWLFTKAHVYPLPISGLQDVMIVGCDRNGPQYIGSSFYSQDEAAFRIAAELQSYLRAGGNPTYDLSNPELYPKPLASCYWQYQILAGGLQFLRIGDVTGPDKGLMHTWNGGKFEEKSRLGWEWTKDPAFAYMIKNYFGRKTEDDATWAAIEAAAATRRRPPYLDQKSRALAMWASILESGTQHDDFRFRRAAYLRIGQGWGHHHNDSLDLQIVAHGMPMTVDGGQRIGYSKPADVTTRVHNLVEVDGQEMLAHSWVNTLLDTAGARYTRATLVPPAAQADLKQYSRQVALLDVDEGEGSQPLKAEQMRPEAKLPPVARTANSYVFDVVRVAGGREHTYSFHGPVNDPDGPQPTTNARDIVKLTDTPPTAGTGAIAAKYLDRFSNDRYYGTAPATFEATFTVQKQRTDKKQVNGTEAFFLGNSYDAAGPDKHLKLHLLGTEGALAMKGDQHCRQWGYFIPNVYVQRQGENLESTFAAIIEPYAGAPFITKRELLRVANNETDAGRAVAVRVETKSGHRDLCFADGRPEKTRTVQTAEGAVQVAGEFGYVSHDAAGLRQATLTGGTLLRTAEVWLQPAAPEHRAKVVSADYRKRRLMLDTAWPSVTGGGRVFEVGTPDKMTQYTAMAVTPAGKGGSITVSEGADFYQSRVKEVDSKAGTVVCALGFANAESYPQRGQDKGWVASNEACTKFWRAEYSGGLRDEGRYTFKLTGGPVTMADFGANGALRLWEYGAGDSVRQATSVSLQRLQAGVYLVEASVACRIGLKVASAEISTDGVKYQKAKTTASGGLSVIDITDKQLGATGKLWLRGK